MRWLPHPIGRGADHLRSSWLCARESAAGTERLYQVSARHTSARRGVRLTERLLRAGYRSADFEFERSETRARLLVRDQEREILRLSVELRGAHEGSMFPSPRAVQEFLASVRTAHPVDPLAPALDELGLSGGAVGLEPLGVREISVGAFGGAGGATADPLELDSAFELVARRRASVTVAAHRAAGVLSSATAAPTP
jgi:hypothetical protein